MDAANQALLEGAKKARSVLRFKSAVHDNSNLNDVDKFSYLKSVVTSDAELAIRGLTLTPENYAKAVKILEDRFGIKELIVDYHMTRLLNLSPVRKSFDVIALRKPYDQLEINIRGLESLEIFPDSYSCLLFPIIMKAIPPDLALEYNKKHNEKQSQVTDLTTYLRGEVESRERTKLLLKPRGAHRIPINIQKEPHESIHSQIKRIKVIRDSSLLINRGEEESISAELRRFWEIESLGIRDNDSVTLGNGDEEILSEFDKSVCFVDGRYIVKYKEQYPHTFDLLNSSIYVDDFICGRNDVPDALRTTLECLQIFSDASMLLRKWRTNSKQLDLLWQQEGVETEFSETSATDLRPPIKVLGLAWDSEKDIIYFDPKDLLKFMSRKTESKRFILGVVGRIFDPNGILGPFVIKLKCLLQDLWTLGVDWYSELPPKLRHKWQQWSSEAEGLTEIKLPRFYLGDVNQELSSVDIHCFSDASKSAYGTILYLRFVTCNNKIETSFICSKSRVAPLKSLTLPRLELTAALLSASSEIKSLVPYLDEDNLLRITGRLLEADLCFGDKHPVILPRHCKFTELLVIREHERIGHCDVSATLTQLRKNYWIRKGRQLVKTMIRIRLICKKYNAKPADQLSGQLPRDRITQSPPFQIVGIDFTGAILVKDNQETHKFSLKKPSENYIFLETKLLIVEGKRFERDRLLKKIREAEEEVGSLDKRHEEALDKAQSEMKVKYENLHSSLVSRVRTVSEGVWDLSRAQQFAALGERQRSIVETQARYRKAVQLALRLRDKKNVLRQEKAALHREMDVETCLSKALEVKAEIAREDFLSAKEIFQKDKEQQGDRKPQENPQEEFETIIKQLEDEVFKKKDQKVELELILSDQERHLKSQEEERVKRKVLHEKLSSMAKVAEMVLGKGVLAEEPEDSIPCLSERTDFLEKMSTILLEVAEGVSKFGEPQSPSGSSDSSMTRPPYAKGVLGLIPKEGI
ncbi:integrase catalytic domain-containing protein [Trichonephila clavata]|uniref:Integrase catalytic domain-containing protein n=1 Tax=Trichonephila clavata TaxID=2740835 RepID=A0A8X6ITU7_TRICU|nr:integrase catalytic domain-containing protein [Trichonephila clavata]